MGKFHTDAERLESVKKLGRSILLVKTFAGENGLNRETFRE